jgi:hypothetical protein
MRPIDLVHLACAQLEQGSILHLNVITEMLKLPMIRGCFVLDLRTRLYH